MFTPTCHKLIWHPSSWDFLPPVSSQSQAGRAGPGWVSRRMGGGRACLLHVCACSLPIGRYVNVLVQVYAVTELVNETWLAWGERGMKELSAALVPSPPCACVDSFFFRVHHFLPHHISFSPPRIMFSNLTFLTLGLNFICFLQEMPNHFVIFFFLKSSCPPPQCINLPCAPLLRSLVNPPVLIPWHETHAASRTLLLDKVRLLCDCEPNFPAQTLWLLAEGGPPPLRAGGGGGESIQNTHHPVRARRGGNKKGFWVKAHCCTEQGYKPAPGLGHRWVRDDSAVCRSAAFLCVTRHNEDLITAAWPLVCLFLCTSGFPVST